MNLPRLEFNIPNLFSLARIVLIPLFIYFVATASWILALLTFAVASLTDFFDGWSARMLNQESEFGKFIDPLADKILVVSALIALMVLDPYMQIFDLWMIFIIVGRDVLLTVMRWRAIRKGTSLHTSQFGKFKTAFQMISIVIIIMIYLVRKEGYDITHRSVPYWIMVGVTVLTALSGVRYLFTNWRLFLPDRYDEARREHRNG